MNPFDLGTGPARAGLLDPAPAAGRPLREAPPPPPAPGAPSLARRLLDTRAGWSPLALRVPVGLVFAAHGAQKLFGWFGGHGLAGTGQWMASIGLEPGWAMALLAGGAEFFGGLALVVGLLVRPASAALAVAMAVAIAAVHLEHGFFAAQNGYEYALVLLAAAVSLAISGGGRAAVDRTLGHRR